jgi:tetratricopeptide (TPR) repeat protein
MENKLKSLRKAMDSTTHKGTHFTEEHRNNVRKRVASKKFTKPTRSHHFFRYGLTAVAMSILVLLFTTELIGKPDVPANQKSGAFKTQVQLVEAMLNEVEQGTIDQLTIPATALEKIRGYYDYMNSLNSQYNQSVLVLGVTENKVDVLLRVDKYSKENNDHLGSEHAGFFVYLDKLDGNWEIVEVEFYYEDFKWNEKGEILTKERVLNDALHFLTLIKEKNIETLAQYWLEDQFINREQNIFDRKVMEEHMVDIVRLYHEVIDFSRPLEVKLLNDEAGDSNQIQIMNMQDREEHFVLTDGSYEDFAIMYTNGRPSFLSYIYMYYPRAQKAIDAYLQAIKDEDKEKLVWLLTEDDVQFPYELTDEVLTKYNKQFDVQSLSAKIIRYSPEKHFVVNVTDKLNNAYQFSIVFGDGLMAIRDDNIPSVSATK